MNTAVVTLSLFLNLVATPLSVHGLSGGAPAGSCTTLTQDHPPNSPQTSTVPYTFDLSVFDNGAGDFVYVPGISYQREENHNLIELLNVSGCYSSLHVVSTVTHSLPLFCSDTL